MRDWGGVTLRGSVARVGPNAEERAEISRAEKNFREMRSRVTADDITPELYLCAVLQEYGQYAEMKPLIATMRKRLPESSELRDLETAVDKWAALQRSAR